MNLFRKLALVSGIVFIISLVVLWKTTWTHQTDTSRLITIQPGSSAISITNQLKSEGLVKSRTVFLIYGKLTGAANQFKSGQYRIPATYTVASLYKLLVDPSNQIAAYKITIPEGFSIKKIANLLEQKQLIKSADAFYKHCHNALHLYKDRFEFLNTSKTNSLEGYLYPDTYFFSYGTNEDQIITAFLTQFNINIYQLWKTAQSKPLNTFHELLTMASIVEKEARYQKEMPTIASVYYNRLKKRMRLEADPTVLYSMGEPNKKIVYYKDLKTKSPYNTYRNFGLPPGPIASPGVLAIKAALKPAETPYLFFVADNTGKHHFTTSYRAHLNIQKVINR